MNYDLSPHMNGGDFSGIVSTASAFIANHHKVIIGVLLVIVLILLFVSGILGSKVSYQSFMPSQTLYQQDQDTVSVGSENTPMGLGTGILGSPGKWFVPGSAKLTSEAVGYCATADAVVPDDAWEWQYRAATGAAGNPAAMAIGNPVGPAAQSIAAQEKFKGKKSDDTLSAIAQGY